MYFHCGGCLLRLPKRGEERMLVVSWLLEREYRLHRLLDINLPETFSKWRATVDARVQRKGCETPERIVKVVIHPGEIETWARHEGRPVNEQARPDYADLLWRIDADFSRAGGATNTPYDDRSSRHRQTAGRARQQAR
jgi:hypothetical protein